MVIASILCLGLAFAASGRAPAAHETNASAAVSAASTTTNGSSEKVLLIHGYTDNCISAFSPEDIDPTSTAGSTAPPVGAKNLSGADTALSNAGFSNVTAVGYYTNESDQNPNPLPPGTTANSESANGCAAAVSDATDVGKTSDGSDSPNDKCASIPHTHTVTVSETGGVTTTVTVDDTGTYNDPIRHVACRLAWYIYDQYTSQSQPVRVLAHSMGGLVIRDAITESGQSAPFPPVALWVDRVVTVASPHGGLEGKYLSNARVFNDSTEVEDMAAGSTLMSYLTAHQDPQGAVHNTQPATFWGLIGAAQSCNPSAPGNDSAAIGGLGDLIDPSCTQNRSATNPYIGGDGIVQSSSQLGMKADVKILYGMLDAVLVGTHETTFTADSATQYGHEWGSGGAGVYVPAPYYLNDNGASATKAFVCVSSCTSTAANNPLGDMGLGASTAVLAPRALGEVVRLLTGVPTTYTIGHAALAGNDYPYDGLGQYDEQKLTDPWHEYDGQCDSFAAWKIYELMGGAARVVSANIPNAGFSPADKAIDKVVGYAGSGAPANNWGDATNWGTKAAGLQITVDDNPSPGAIAWWAASSTMPVGHVGFTTDVYPDGSVTIEGYNLRANGEYSTLYLNREGADDTSFNLPAFHVPWPSGFIHFVAPTADIAGPPLPPPSPAFHYPHNTYGPGDGGGFTLAGSAYPGTTNGWYLDAGHGQIGGELWTNTHRGAANSIATWSPSLTAGACYEIDAFVPDNWSNNSAALYTVTDQAFGTSLIPVDENSTTNGYVPLGVFKARSDATLPVTLTDQGSGTGQVAADAMRYLLQGSCAGVVRASQTVGAPSLAGTAYTGTVNGWYSDSGNGQLGTAYYTYTNGITPGSSATWSATVTPSACYQIYAYVPGAHANDYQAQYAIGSATSTAPVVSVDENLFTNNFASLGIYRSDSGGHLTVILTDQSLASSDAYVNADTMSFVRTDCPLSPYVIQGSTYPALVEGPGSPLTQFAVSSDWYNQFGVGYRGYEKWTHTVGTIASSKATWTFTTGLSANTAYTVCAYIPDNFANNTAAHYQGFEGTSATAVFTSVIDQNATTGWTYLGVLPTGTTGKLTVTLDDTGPTSTNGVTSYTAADAMKVIAAGSC